MQLNGRAYAMNKLANRGESEADLAGLCHAAHSADKRTATAAGQPLRCVPGLPPPLLQQVCHFPVFLMRHAHTAHHVPMMIVVICCAIFCFWAQL